MHEPGLKKDTRYLLRFLPQSTGHALTRGEKSLPETWCLYTPPVFCACAWSTSPRRIFLQQHPAVDTAAATFNLESKSLSSESDDISP